MASAHVQPAAPLRLPQGTQGHGIQSSCAVPSLLHIPYPVPHLQPNQVMMAIIALCAIFACILHLHRHHTSERQGTLDAHAKDGSSQCGRCPVACTHMGSLQRDHWSSKNRQHLTEAARLHPQQHALGTAACWRLPTKRAKMTQEQRCALVVVLSHLPTASGLD